MTKPTQPNKDELYQLPSEIAFGLERHLETSRDGYFPICDGDRIIGVFVSVDRFKDSKNSAQKVVIIGQGGWGGIGPS